MNDSSGGARAAPRAADAQATKSEPRWRYRVTLLMFAIVAAALVLWFQRHVEPFVTETLIIGGTMSLWGLWKLGWSMYEDAGGGSGKDFTRKLLGGPGALRALVFGLIIVVLLHAWTSSVYLRYGGAPPGEESFKVRVMDGDTVFMGPFDIGPGASTVGYPMFPRFSTLRLRYELVEPRGYLPFDADLAPWSAHDYKVPGGFKRKPIHVLRLVPGFALLPDLPKPGESGGPRYYLELRARGQTALIGDLTKSIVITGATQPDLPDPLTLGRDATLRQEIADYLNRAPVNKPEAIAAGLLGAAAQTLASVELAGNDDVVVEIGINGEPREVVVTCRLKVPASTGGRHTFIVGPGEGSCQ